MPQFVVDGKAIQPSYETVMPDTKKEEVRKKILRAAKRPTPFDLDAQFRITEKDTLEASVSLDLSNGETSQEDVRVVPVLFRRHAFSTPTSGWNQGKSLRDAFVALAILDPISGEEAASPSGSSFEVHPPANLDLVELGLVFLVEDVETGKPLESRAVLLTKENQSRPAH